MVIRVGQCLHPTTMGPCLKKGARYTVAEQGDRSNRRAACRTAPTSVRQYCPTIRTHYTSVIMFRIVTYGWLFAAKLALDS